MRLWHKDLLHKLPRAQLLGQHRECSALRGLGWNRKHSTVDYVFTYPFSWLVWYHFQVMEEMSKRGYNVDEAWLNPEYRGKRLGYCSVDTDSIADYPEHNQSYLVECLENLKDKGIYI